MLHLMCVLVTLSILCVCHVHSTPVYWTGMCRYLSCTDSMLTDFCQMLTDVVVCMLARCCI